MQEPLACAPAAMAVKSFSSMPARSALVCWCACSVSKTSIGEGGWVGIGEILHVSIEVRVPYRKHRPPLCHPDRSEGICNQHLIRIEAAEDLLASLYAAVSCSFAIDLRCACSGVPGAIVCPDALVNNGAS